MAGARGVVLGGTFDHLHIGHEALLGTAFRAGRRVSIGLTTDAYLAAHPKPGADRIAPYSVRRRRLTRWLGARFPRSRWTVVPISDGFGGSVEDGVDALVVSAETVGGGQAVNEERRRRGRRPVPVLVVPLVLADDLQPVSSRRVRSGAIDRWGRRRSPIDIAVEASDPRDRRPVERAIRRAFPRARLRPGGSGPGRRPPELTVAVRADRTPARWVSVASEAVRLPPVPVDGRTPATLARGVERVLRRSRRTHRLSPTRR